MIHTRQALVILICASMVLSAGCLGAGWGTNGPAEDEDTSANESASNETGANETNSENETNETGTNDSHTTDDDTADSDSESASSSDTDSQSQEESSSDCCPTDSDGATDEPSDDGDQDSADGTDSDDATDGDESDAPSEDNETDPAGDNESDAPSEDNETDPAGDNESDAPSEDNETDPAGDNESDAPTEPDSDNEFEDSATGIVRVVDENGDPVEGEPVTLQPPGAVEEESYEERTTDENGEVEIELLAGEPEDVVMYTVEVRGEEKHLGIMSDEHVGVQEVEFVVGDDNGEGDGEQDQFYQFERTVLVTDEDGTPLPNEPVEFQTLAGEEWQDAGTTDDSGEITLTASSSEPGDAYLYDVRVRGEVTSGIPVDNQDREPAVVTVDTSEDGTENGTENESGNETTTENETMAGNETMTDNESANENETQSAAAA